ncbi:MAG: hypothetical protein WC107_05360 [Patescibacteria group bacterium]
MGKKKNKKFKTSNSTPAIKAANETPVSHGQLEVSADGENKIVETKAVQEEIDLLNEKYRFVRHDVKKLLLTIAGLAVLIVATYFISQKTSYLGSLGDWIYKIGNFSA